MTPGTVSDIATPSPTRVPGGVRQIRDAGLHWYACPDAAGVLHPVKLRTWRGTRWNRSLEVWEPVSWTEPTPWSAAGATTTPYEAYADCFIRCYSGNAAHRALPREVAA